MAIAPDTAIAIRRVPGGDALRLANIDPARYPPASFPTDPAQAVDTAHHAWGNYFVCAYKGCFEWAASAGVDLEPAGLEVMVHGTVPLGESLLKNKRTWRERERERGDGMGWRERDRMDARPFICAPFFHSTPQAPACPRPPPWYARACWQSWPCTGRPRRRG